MPYPFLKSVLHPFELIHRPHRQSLQCSVYKIVELLYKYLTSLYFKGEETIVCPCTVSIRLCFKSRQTPWWRQRTLHHFFFWFIYFTWVLYLHVHAYACQKRAADPSVDGCEPPHACWESNPEPLWELLSHLSVPVTPILVSWLTGGFDP